MTLVKHIAYWLVKILVTALLLTGYNAIIYAQDTLTIKDTRIKLIDDVPFYINGSMVNDSGSVLNSGEILLKGNIINNFNDSLFDQNGLGKLYFTGDTLQKITGKYPVRFQKIIINKKDSTVLLGVDISVSDSIVFKKGNIDLQGKNLYLNNENLSFNGFLDVEKDTSRIVSDSGYVWTQMPLDFFIDYSGLGLGILLNNKLGGDIKVERGHTSETTVTDGSIKKYYNLYPDNAISEEIIIHYLDSVDFFGVNGNEKDFMLWTSYTNGYYYENKYGVVDTAGNYVTTNGEMINIKNPTRVTVSDHICDDPPKVSLGPDTLNVCKGDNTVLNAGNTGYDFIWNTNDTTQKITVNTSGKYEVMVTDPLGCFTYDSIVVVIDSLPYPEFTTFSGNNYICRSDSFTFTNTSHVHSSGAPMAYLWEFGDGTTSKDSVISKKYTAPGSYTVSLTTYSSSGCFQQATKNVTVNPLPNVKFDFGNVCQTDEIYFTNSSSGVISENLWDFGNGDTSSLTSPVYTYPDSGKYEVTLTVSNNFNCSDSLKKSISIYSPGKANFNTEDANVCLGNQSVFHNTSTIEEGTMTYAWDFGNGIKSTTPNPIIIYENPGTYNVTLIATSNHGCGDTIQKPVTIYPIPTSDFTFNEVCLGDTTQLINNSFINPDEPLEYQWTLGDKTTSVNQDVNKVYDTPGIYKVTLKTTSSNGCASSVDKFINVYTTPTANFTVQDVCLTNVAEFKDHSFPDDGSLNYEWSFSDGESSILQEPSHEYLSQGLYTTKLLVQTANGCIDSISKNININPLPVVDIGDTIFHCENTYVIDAGNAGAEYLWSDNSKNQTLTAKESGNYAVTVTSGLGCENADDVFVDLNNPVTIDLGGTSIDACDSVTLDAGYPGAEYLWSTGETTRKILVQHNGEYSVTVNSQGCTGEASTSVTIHNSPDIDLGNDITACEGTTVPLNAATSGLDYEWSTGETTQSIQVNASGTYTVTVTNANGCQNSDDIHVQFNPLPEQPFTQDVTVCGSTVLDAQNEGATYLWNDGSVNQTLLVENSGLYTVEITPGNDCSLTDSIYVTVNPKPSFYLGADTSICNGETLSLDAQNDGAEYLWNNGSNNRIREITSTGEYWVSVTNSYNCSSVDTITVVVKPSPQVELGNDLYLCKNQQALLDAGDYGASYTWGSSTGFYAEENRVFVTDSGKYWVDVINTHGCKATDTVHIQHSDFSITAYFLAPSQAKIGDTIQFVDVSYPEPENYFWDFNDGTTTTQELPLHIFYKEGNYRVLLNVSNNFCSDTISKPLNIEGVNKFFLEEDKDNSLRAKYFEIKEANIFPNPTDGEFVFELQLNQRNMVMLSLYDVQGKLIYNEKIESVSYLYKSYDFSKLKPGIYIFKMLVKDQEKSYRIIKMK